MSERSCSTCKYDGKSADEAPCVECKHRYMDKYAPMTNGDRIRQMTDEELALILMCPYQFTEHECTNNTLCYSCTKKWLREVAVDAEQM